MIPVARVVQIWCILWTYCSSLPLEVTLGTSNWHRIPALVQIYEALRFTDDRLDIAHDSPHSVSRRWLQACAADEAPDSLLLAACHAFGHDTNCESYQPVLQSPLLRRSLDSLTSNGFFRPSIEYEIQQSKVERELLHNIGATGCQQAAALSQPWTSIYTFDNQTITKAGCVNDFDLNSVEFRPVTFEESEVLTKTLDFPQHSSSNNRVVTYHAQLKTKMALIDLAQILASSGVRFKHDEGDGESSGAELVDELEYWNEIGSWGVTLALKNPEYKTVDEQAGQENQADEAKKSHESAFKSQSNEEDDKVDFDQDQEDFFDIQAWKDVEVSNLLDLVSRGKSLFSNLGGAFLSYITEQLNVTRDPLEKIDVLERIVQDIPESILKALKSQRSNIATDSTIADHLKKLMKAHGKLRRTMRTRWNMFAINDNIVGSVASHLAQSSYMKNVVYLFNLLDEHIIPLAVREERFASLGAPITGSIVRGSSELSASTISEGIKLTKRFLNNRDSRHKWDDGMMRWDYRKVTKHIPSVSLDRFFSSPRSGAGIQNVSEKVFLRNLETFAFSDVLSQTNVTLWKDSTAIQLVFNPLDTQQKRQCTKLFEVLKSIPMVQNANVVVIPTSPKFVQVLVSHSDSQEIDYSEFQSLLANPHVGAVKDDRKNDLVLEVINNINTAGLSPFTVFVNGKGFQLNDVDVDTIDNEDQAIEFLVAAMKTQIESDVRRLALDLLLKFSPILMMAGDSDNPGKSMIEDLQSTNDVVSMLKSTDRLKSNGHLLSNDDKKLLEQITENEDLMTNDSKKKKNYIPTLEDYFLARSTTTVLQFVGNSGQVKTLGGSKLTSKEFPLKYSFSAEILAYLSTAKGDGMSAIDSLLPLDVVIIHRLDSAVFTEWSYTSQGNSFLKIRAHVARVGANLICFRDDRCVDFHPNHLGTIGEDEFVVIAGGLAARVPYTEAWKKNVQRAIDSLSELHTSFLQLSVLNCERRRIITGSYAPLCLQNVNLTELTTAPAAVAFWYEEHTNGILDGEFDTSHNYRIKTMAEVFEKTSLRHLRLSARRTNSEGKLISLRAVIDPLSKWGQHLIPIVKYLYKYLYADVRLVLNPDWRYKSLPLNRWSRTVIYPPLTEILRNKSVSRFADFKSVETNETLVMSLETPDQWMTRSLDRELDTDNVRSVDINRWSQDGIHTTKYDLQGLYIEGSVEAFEQQPSGSVTPSERLAGGHSLRVENIMAHSADVLDTISLFHPGYFQFPADKMGKYEITVINKDVALDVSSHKSPITELAHYDVSRLRSESEPDENLVWVNSFRSSSPKIRILGELRETEKAAKKDISNKQSLFSKAVRMMKRNISPIEKAESNEMINIFSLASGHMYERLLRIMMVSVRQNTRRPITFWILDNFLSAKFRETASHFASKLDNVTINYVSYKWPPFLRPQVEKQRQIWANKILFLDVLFPLSVKKIIYVDADQIVRGDIGQLWDMDLQGNVYGFTPFCSDREETKHLRFWEQGYWKEHLMDKRYHISALFVVDLDLFRKQQIGSQLRISYNALSSDPNSLSNLDQDLPNYAQHQIPIFSLPPEWLWCETWCSDEKKPFAKTIDLCNNPLTHESKLAQAKRIAPEWIKYDAMATSYLNISLEDEKPPVFDNLSAGNHPCLDKKDDEFYAQNHIHNIHDDRTDEL